MFEILEIAEDELRKVSLDDLRRGMAASIACRAAIKINMRLDHTKMEWLLRELAATECPMSCPHGRPDRAALLHARHSEELPPDLSALLPLDGAGRLMRQIVEDGADALDVQHLVAIRSSRSSGIATACAVMPSTE